MDELTANAQRWGIEPEYYDVFGKRHAAGAETLRRLIAAISAGQARPNHCEEAAGQTSRAFQGDGRRLWALAVQLYALRSRRNWGHGDFTDLAQLDRHRRRAGRRRRIGLNPLHALFMDRAEQASPYAPNSRLFLNPLYIDVEAIEEFPAPLPPAWKAKSPRCAQPTLIDYAGVARAKLAALELAHTTLSHGWRARSGAPISTLFGEQQGDTLLRFACFETLRAAIRAAAVAGMAVALAPSVDAVSCRPSATRTNGTANSTNSCNGSPTASCAPARRRRAASACRSAFICDLAVGMDRHGADAWIQQDVVLRRRLGRRAARRVQSGRAGLGPGAVQSARAGGETTSRRSAA